MFRCALAVYLFIFGLEGSACLRLLSLDVPPAVMQGDSIWLNCTLDLESDDLYSVKWYRNDVEFYRYLPQNSPTGQKYDLPGIHLDIELSVHGNVYLKDVNLETEGMYRCEASAESPTFQTVEGEKQIKVYALPQVDPTIEGSQPMYEVGDYVNVTCRSGASKPAASLKWFVNGKEVYYQRETGSATLITYPTIVSSNGLEISLLGLTFKVKESHLFKGGGINLRCIATVSQTYATTSEELIVGNKPTGTTSLNPFTLITREGPIITGDKAHYKVGDMLDINCSSSKSNPAPELQWFLNEEKADISELVHYKTRVHGDGQETSTLGLRLMVQPRHLLPNGEMRLKCTASLSKVINVRSDERTLGGNHRTSGFHVAENLGTVIKRSNSASRLTFLPEYVLLFTVLVYF